MFNYSRLIKNDYGPDPYIINISESSLNNKFFRQTIWTGKNLQLTLMSIPAGGEIGLENHSHVDQFLKIEKGQGLVLMGKNKDNFTIKKNVQAGFAIFIPAGTWHNLINTANIPIKLYSIYAPPNHPPGTIHVTKEMAENY